MSSDAAWWQRPVWPSTRVVTWGERRARVRRVAAPVGRVLARPAAIAVVGALGGAALGTAVWFVGASQVHPEWLWVAGTVAVAAVAWAWVGRTRGARRGALGSPAAAPVAALMTVAVLLGVPWALAGPASAGGARALAAGVPADVYEAAQVGEHVGLVSSDGLTMVDLATGTARPVQLDGDVTWLNAVPGGLLATTTTGQALVAEDGTVRWQQHGVSPDALTAVAAAGDVVVLAQHTLHRGPALSAVALRADGSQAWTLDATSPFARPFTPGGVLEYGAALPGVAVLDIDGTPTAVDVATGRPVHSEPRTAAVATLGDLVLWQQTLDGAPAPAATDAACRVLATRGGTQAWSVTAPCIGDVDIAHGSTAVYLHPVEVGTSEVALDLTTGATRGLTEAWPLAVTAQAAITFDLSGPGDAAGRAVARDPGTGRALWTLPSTGRVLDAVWTSSTADALVTTGRPLGFNPLAGWRAGQQVSLVDPASGAVVAAQTCTGSARGWALSDGRGLSVCAGPDGTGTLSLLGPKS